MNSKKVWIIGGIAAVLAGVLQLAAYGEIFTSSSEPAAPRTSTYSQAPTRSTPSTAAPAPTTTETATKAAPPSVKAKSTLSVYRRNAIRSAESYLDYTAFSRSGLIKQLKFEGYSTSDATYAVDSLNVSWNTQAAKKAQEYLDFTAFSRSGLIRQLKHEGFTTKQATYGVNEVGL